MCIDCGCGSAQHHHDHAADAQTKSTVAPRTVRIAADLLAHNARFAAANRQHFRDHGLLVLNLVSSPGSGKTTLLERTLTDLQGSVRFAVLEGDQQTSRDAERIAATGVPAVQINTGTGCHLDAHMVAHGAADLNLHATDILMIENVGNLVCPAGFDLGEDHKIALLSVTEGEDKPLKYPHLFRAADIIIINKIDLLPYVRFDVPRCRNYAQQVNPGVRIFELSAESGVGLAAWYDWLTAAVQSRRSPGHPK